MSFCLSRHRLLFAELALLACWPLGCGGQSTQRLGGETNWLSHCQSDTDCRIGECICGACSATCETDDACADLQGAGCALSGEPAYSAQCGASAPTTSGVCLPECETRADCGSDQQCVDAKCILQASAVGSVCPDGSDGSRFGDQSPDPTDTYLQDCANPLAREYYRVFATEAGTAYIYPAPGASQTILEACTATDSPITTILTEYGLCENSEAAAANSMTPEDATALARYLHQHLVFAPNANGIAPTALASDIYQVCLSDAAFAAGVMAERCSFEIGAVESGSRSEQGWTFNREQAVVTALALNDLYGVAQSDQCDRLGARAQFELGQGLGALDLSCSAPEDCSLKYAEVGCLSDCGRVASVASESERTALMTQVEGSVCAAYAEAECPEVLALPCYPMFVDCVDGLCREVETP